MANHPSAEKRNRQRIKRTIHNRSIVSALRTSVKKARKALADGNADTAEEKVQQAAIALAKAGGKGVVPLRMAARTTSRITKALHRLKSAQVG
ncbi:30S ribosomal protein S20 [Myxococcota bacterium]